MAACPATQLFTKVDRWLAHGSAAQLAGRKATCQKSCVQSLPGCVLSSISSMPGATCHACNSSTRLPLTCDACRCGGSSR